MGTHPETEQERRRRESRELAQNIASALDHGKTDEEIEAESQARRYGRIDSAANYKLKATAIDQLRTRRRVPPGPCPAVTLCANRFPGSTVRQTARGWEVVQGRHVLGRGSSIARACKAALKGARS